MKKSIIVRESLDWEREDPYRMLGIGLSWTNLKPGILLRAKMDIGIDSYMRFNNQSYYSRINKDRVLTIKKVDYDWHGNELYIYFGFESVAGSIKQFKNRFDIVGYKKLEETLDWERKDPYGILGIGMEEKVRKWIEESELPSFGEEPGILLIAAVEDNRPDLVKYFLSKGADPNSWNSEALTSSVYFGSSKEIVEILLQAGANANAIYPFDISIRNLDFIPLLHKYGLDLSSYSGFITRLFSAGVSIEKILDILDLGESWDFSLMKIGFDFIRISNERIKDREKLLKWMDMHPEKDKGGK